MSSDNYTYKPTLEFHKELNRLVVAEATLDDNTIVSLHLDTMDLLAMYRGDTVKIVGKKHRYTIAVAIADEECEIGKIKMNEVMRKNLNICPEYPSDILALSQL